MHSLSIKEIGTKYGTKECIFTNSIGWIKTLNINPGCATEKLFRRWVFELHGNKHLITLSYLSVHPVLVSKGEVQCSDFFIMLCINLLQSLCTFCSMEWHCCPCSGHDDTLGSWEACFDYKTLWKYAKNVNLFLSILDCNFSGDASLHCSPFKDT